MDIDTVVRALRICNQPKGHRCSECPVFSRYEHRICKATVDRFAADLIESLQSQLSASQQRERDARNELCLSCRKYREAHKGACDGCKWKENK